MENNNKDVNKESENLETANNLNSSTDIDKISVAVEKGIMEVYNK